MQAVLPPNYLLLGIALGQSCLINDLRSVRSFRVQRRKLVALRKASLNQKCSTFPSNFPLEYFLMGTLEMGLCSSTIIIPEESQARVFPSSFRPIIRILSQRQQIASHIKYSLRSRWMKNHYLGLVRTFFSDIQNQIADRLKAALKTKYDSSKPHSVLRSVMRDYFSEDKQNHCRNNRQLDSSKKVSAQKYQDQTQKLLKMKKQVDLEFEMTRNFIKEFSRNNNRAPEMSYLYSPRGHQAKNLNVSVDLDPAQEKNVSAHNLSALNKLKKLQKFMCKQQKGVCATSRNFPQQYTFSPSKQEYKQQNKRLRVELSNVKSQLSTLQNNTQLHLDEEIKHQREELLKRSRELSVLEAELMNKEQRLTKRQAEFMVKTKLYKHI